MMAMTGNLITQTFRNRPLCFFNNFAMKFFDFFALDTAQVIMVLIGINLKNMSIMLSMTDQYLEFLKLSQDPINTGQANIF